MPLARMKESCMREIEDFSDDRFKSWCIHCGAWIAEVESNRDHVPTKSLLTKDMRKLGANYDKGAGGEFDYLPQVTVCRACNAGFAADENYLLCVLHAVKAGSLYPDPNKYPEAATILRSNRQVVRSLMADPDGQLFLFKSLKPFTVYPDTQKVRRIILKNARGHAYHELGEPLLEEPDEVTFLPIERMTAEKRQVFEAVSGGAGFSGWPEVGSRMMVNLFDDKVMVGGWITVESGRYRYSVDWHDGITVKTVIWDYLATETHWAQ
jgi:hypothetical protein